MQLEANRDEKIKLKDVLSFLEAGASGYTKEKYHKFNDFIYAQKNKWFLLAIFSTIFAIILGIYTIICLLDNNQNIFVYYVILTLFVLIVIFDIQFNRYKKIRLKLKEMYDNNFKTKLE